MKCYECHKNIQGNHFYGMHRKCYLTAFKLNKPLEFENIHPVSMESNEPFITANLKRYNSSFFQGAYKKYAAKLNNKHYILKIEENEYPELPATEFICNKIGDLLRLPVPKYYLIDFSGLECFVTENFMTPIKMSNLIHIYHYVKKDDEFNCETLLNIIKNNTQSIKDIHTFIKMTLFDALIGNHDRHGRNIAFIQTNTNLALSPVYDNPSYLGIEDKRLLKAHFEPRGKIYTKHSTTPTMTDYVEEWKRLGYNNIVVNFFKSIKIKHIEETVQKCRISETRRAALLGLVKRRFKELQNAIIKT